MTCCGFLNFLVLFSVFKDGSSNKRNDNLLQLLSNANVKPPYIAIVFPQGKNIEENNNRISEEDLTDDITPEIDSLDPPHDKKAYLLYHLLRTTEEREQIDPEAARSFEQTKDILRQALRNRCDKLDLCNRKCPKKIKITCTVECQDKYDDFNVCGTIQTYCNTNKSKCGRTMPPKWLRQQ